MPKATDEATALKIVELKKQGKSYTEIASAAQVTEPTVTKVLKRAGLAKSRPRKPKTVPTSTPAPNSSEKPGSAPSNSGSAGNGLDDFIPRVAKPEVQSAKAPIGEMSCDNCGATFTYDDPNDLNESCPECGQ